MRRRIRHFFFPPSESSRLRRVFPWAMIVAIPAVILLVIPATWEYSNSPGFCGTTCHTMPPEYNTYLVSPHARVPCVDCHLGRDTVYEQFIRKTGHMRLIYATITGDYEYPIRVSSMRPARETCEKCHYPEKFSDDSLRALHRFADDEDNTPYDIYLLMHTGGGSQREGLGQGIHWHIENKVEYIALGPEEQDIPWVRVNYADGTTTEFLAEGATIDTANLDQYTIHEMDCITCHNRISHLFDNPRRQIDTALYRGDLSADIPFIRAHAVELLSEEYESTEQAKAAFHTLVDYYQENHPEFYADNQDKIAGAIALLGQLYDENTFPDQELDWRTHPNNIGHRDWPGCFRCHDGEHFDAQAEAIPLECNLCHSIPQIVRPGEIEPMLPLTTGIEPSSHLVSTWISRHHNELNDTCSNCHTTQNAGGTSDTSFCSNSGCHGVDWRYAGFDAPTLAIQLGVEQQPEEEPEPTVGEGEAVTYQTLQPIFTEKCAQCHGDSPTKGLRVTDYDSLLTGSDNGPVITRGSPDDSRIVAVLTQGHFATLTDEEMTLLTQWIADGAPEGAPEEPARAPATYETLQPILVRTCGGCHSGDAPPKGLRVTDYESLLLGAEDGAVIVPGSPDDSRIIEVLKQGHFAKLTDEEMALLTQWIADGAPLDETGAAPEATPTETPEETTGEAVTYQTLQPVFQQTCGMCHSGDTPPKGLRVTDYDGLIAGGEDGPVIVPGSPDDSRIIEVLTQGHFAKLTDEEMAQLTQWIADGALEGEAVAPAEEPTPTPTEKPAPTPEDEE